MLFCRCCCFCFMYSEACSFLRVVQSLNVLFFVQYTRLSFQGNGLMTSIFPQPADILKNRVNAIDILFIFLQTQRLLFKSMWKHLGKTYYSDTDLKCISGLQKQLISNWSIFWAGLDKMLIQATNKQAKALNNKLSSRFKTAQWSYMQ